MNSTIHNHRVTDSLIHNHVLKDAAPSLDNILKNGTLDEINPESLDKVLGVYHYSGRVLGSTQPQDVLQLPNDLKCHWPWIREHYERAGISHAQQIIWDDDMQLMGEFPSHEPSVFFFGKNANDARPDQEWYDIVQQMNSKNNFIKLCQALGIPTPKTWCYDCKKQMPALESFQYPLYLKLAVSVSGLGVVRCENAKELAWHLEYISEGVAFQVQEDIHAFAFLNLQYTKNGELRRVLATEQVLKGNCHNGNAFPTMYQPWEYTDKLAQLMVQQGIKGTFAFDLAAVRHGSDVKYYAIECNPRWNGSSYPTQIALKLTAPCWKAKKFNTKYSSFSNIDLGEIEYNPKSEQGVVIVNWGCITEQELGVMLIGNPSQQEMLEEKLMSILQ